MLSPSRFFSNKDCEGSPFGLIQNTATSLEASTPTVLFPSRYREHVAYALRQIVPSSIDDSPAAVSSVYLATRFEYYFRVLSGCLDADGKWLDTATRDRVCRRLGFDKRRHRHRISNIAKTYKILLAESAHPVVSHLTRIDGKLFASPIEILGGGRENTLHNIGDRIAAMRHRAGHGVWGDISGEAMFFALLTCVIYLSDFEDSNPGSGA